MPHPVDEPKFERERPREPREDAACRPAARNPRPKEIGGPQGPEPTRYGDWERNGRCTDF